MTNFVFANDVQTTLSASAGSSATSLTLSSSANLPSLATGQIMPITLNDAATGLIYEVCYVTAISGGSLTVIRAQEGTVAQSWAIGDYAMVAPTAGTTASSNGNPLNTFQVAHATTSNQAVSLNQTVGSGTITDLTLSRSIGVTYTNNTLRPLVVYTFIRSSAAIFSSTLTVNGIVLFGSSAFAVNDSVGSTYIVPPGATYVAGGNAGTLTLDKWVEY